MEEIQSVVASENPFTIYVLTFFSLIFAFIAAEFFSGWRSVFQYRQEAPASLVHLTWSILFFLIMIENWWGLWRWRRFLSEAFLNALWILPNLVLLLLCLWALFPTHEPRERRHWQTKLLENQRIFSCFGVLLLLKFSFDAAVLNGEEIISVPNGIRWVAALILLAVGLGGRRVWLHWTAIAVLAGLFASFLALTHI